MPSHLRKSLKGPAPVPVASSVQKYQVENRLMGRCTSKSWGSTTNCFRLFCVSSVADCGPKLDDKCSMVSELGGVLRQTSTTWAPLLVCAGVAPLRDDGRARCGHGTHLDELTLEPTADTRGEIASGAWSLHHARLPDQIRRHQRMPSVLRRRNRFTQQPSPRGYCASESCESSGVTAGCVREVVGNQWRKISAWTRQRAALRCNHEQMPLAGHQRG